MMKRILLIFYSVMIIFLLTACSTDEAQSPDSTSTIMPSPPITQESEKPTEKPTDGAEEKPEDEPSSEAPSEISPEVSSSENSSQTNSDKLLLKLSTQQGETTVFALNNSSAALSLYEQLPLSLEIENYSNNEKIFYPPKKLDTSNTPLAKGPVGTLAYYAPWGNVAIYYGDCTGANDLYQLGQATSGTEYIPQLSGVIKLEAVSNEESSLLVTPAPNTPTPEAEQQEAINNIQIEVASKVFSMTLEENTSVDAFIELVKKAPVVIQMSDYSGFEKVGNLGTSLPESNRQITAQAGDIVLYNGNQICVFYGTNSWSYTKLGKIDDLSGWEEALGSGDVTLTFSTI